MFIIKYMFHAITFSFINQNYLCSDSNTPIMLRNNVTSVYNSWKNVCSCCIV